MTVGLECVSCVLLSYLKPLPSPSAWLSSGSPAPMFGMWDTVHNLSARYLVQARFDAACRFDRMLFSSHNLRCVQLELACTEVISTSVDGLPVQLHASDHWGLFAAFSFV